MITDKRVLEADFQPAEVLHRHDKINYLSQILEPVLEGERVTGAILFGPTGTGKTCSTQFLLDRLEGMSEAVETAHIDCWGNHTRSAILHRLLEEVPKSISPNSRSTPTDELTKQLRECIDYPFVIVLDEADQIEEDAILYDLYQIPQVTTLLVANDDEQLLAGLESRVDSRYTAVPRLEFPKYTDAQLVGILTARADAGLEPGVIDQSGLAVIADAAAGDARVAIGILRNAAERAVHQNLDQIHGETILDVVDVAREEVRRKTLSSLTKHQRLVLETLLELGEAPMGEIYPAYSERAGTARSERSVRTYLQKMVHYNLVQSAGEKSARTYRVADPINEEEIQVIGPRYVVD